MSDEFYGFDDEDFDCCEHGVGFDEDCEDCGKPYRAHLLHDKNKCHPNGDAAWFPGAIAKALEGK